MERFRVVEKESLGGFHSIYAVNSKATIQIDPTKIIPKETEQDEISSRST